MTDRTTVRVQDTVLGILVLLLAVFCYYGAWAITSFIPLWWFVLLLVANWFARLFLQMALSFIRGIDVDIS